MKLLTHNLNFTCEVWLKLTLFFFGESVTIALHVLTERKLNWYEMCTGHGRSVTI